MVELALARVIEKGTFYLYKNTDITNEKVSRIPQLCKVENFHDSGYVVRLGQGFNELAIKTGNFYRLDKVLETNGKIDLENIMLYLREYAFNYNAYVQHIHKTLSLILRTNPKELGVYFDEDGYARLAEIVDSLMHREANPYFVKNKWDMLMILTDILKEPNLGYALKSNDVTLGRKIRVKLIK
ncbi:RNA 2'-phosphotransferase [compost metagenome]